MTRSTSLPSYGYPGLQPIERVMNALGNTWVNVRKLSHLTGLAEWRIRSSLAFLSLLGMVEMRRAGRINLYRLVRRDDLRRAFLGNEIFFWILWSLLTGKEVRRGHVFRFAIRFSQDIGLVSEGELTAEGRREVMAEAVRRAYSEIAGPGELVPLDEISRVLEEWGLPRWEFRRSVLGALALIEGVEVVRLAGRRGLRGEGDYLRMHGVRLPAESLKS